MKTIGGASRPYHSEGCGYSPLLKLGTKDAIDSPTGLNRINLRSTSFEVIWNQLPNIDYKVVVVRPGSRFPTSPPVDIDLATSPHLVTSTYWGENIEPITRYTFYVFAINRWNQSDFAETKGGFTSAQEPPVDVKISNVTTNQFLVSWNGNNASIKLHETRRYVVTYATNGTSQSKQTDSNNTYLSITGLLPNTKYDVYVKKQSVNPDVFSDDSISVNGTTVPGAPVVSLTRPSGPSADNTTMIEVGWNKPDGGDAIDNYTIEWRNESDARYFKTIPHTSGTTSYTYIVGNLTPGSFYRFIVRSHNSAGDGDQSKPQELRSVPAKPWPPTLSQFQDDKISSLLVTWTKPSGISDAYQVKLYQGRYLRHNETTSQLSMLVCGLESRASYKATVTAISSHLYGSESESSSQTRTNPPTPLNVTLMQSSDENNSTQLIISWNIPDGLLFNMISYQIIMRSSRGPLLLYPYYAYKTNPMSYVVGGLTPGEIYTSTVQSVSPSEGPAATLSKVSAMSNAVVTKPSEPNHNAFVSFDEIQLNWNLVGYADGFVIKFVKNQVIEVNGSSNSFTFTNLNESTRYKIGMYSWVKDNDGEIYNSTFETKIYTTLSMVPSMLVEQSNQGLIAGLVIMTILVFLLILGIYTNQRQNKQRKEKLFATRLRWIDDRQNAEDNISMNISEHRVIQLANFNQHLSMLRAEQDFKELQEVGKEMTKEITVTEENLTKIRYKKSIYMYDSTRVKLSPIADVPGSDFINANFVSGYRGKNEFIATQGPLPTTINDFWRMVWEQRCATIVMLTQIVEAGRVKCALYWPLKDEPDMDVGDMTLELVSEKSATNWIHRYFKLTRGEETRDISQIHYTSWPDHGVPEVTQNVLEFVKYFQEVFEENPVQPTIVHCSAGVGRTGTFIAMDRLLQHMKDHDYVDIFGIVHEMRMCRTSMVQNKDQYVLIHAMVQDVINDIYGDTEADPVYQNTFSSTAVYETVHFA
ncbi:receptor-type tyrosine-protein phosphatase eta-like isoform X2 [Clavelina lepadiformis]|uniref:receptor-type tyrosine-protein phosphatase eta-like isoform X2 n=1 Tax=Clavelina lepadiformis TaxID=159417 RepID=UPI00404393A6